MTTKEEKNTTEIQQNRFAESLTISQLFYLVHLLALFHQIFYRSGPVRFHEDTWPLSGAIRVVALLSSGGIEKRDTSHIQTFVIRTATKMGLGNRGKSNSSLIISARYARLSLFSVGRGKNRNERAEQRQIRPKTNTQLRSTREKRKSERKHFKEEV